MANQEENYIRCYDRILTPEGNFIKISRWTSSDSIECADGSKLEDKLNDISGITSDLNCADEKIAASAKSANILYKNANALSARVDQCFQNVSNGKALVASAITDKGISTSQDATFQQMANNIQSLVTMSANPTVLFDVSSWTAPRNCIAILSFSVYWKANHDYKQTSLVALSGVKSWEMKWGGTHDSHWHDYSGSGNVTWEARAGQTYTLSTNFNNWKEVLAWGWNSRVWVV